MADLTHAKLAHKLIADVGDHPASDAKRALLVARGHAYATLACADALDRIATVLERQDAPPEYVDPT